ncbi:MAG: hypothetical protein WCO61_11195 [Alphaproteobacteria bacterium]
MSDSRQKLSTRSSMELVAKPRRGRKLRHAAASTYARDAIKT